MNCNKWENKLYFADCDCDSSAICVPVTWRKTNKRCWSEFVHSCPTFLFSFTLCLWLWYEMTVAGLWLWLRPNLWVPSSFSDLILLRYSSASLSGSVFFASCVDLEWNSMLSNMISLDKWNLSSIQSQALTSNVCPSLKWCCAWPVHSISSLIDLNAVLILMPSGKREIVAKFWQFSFFLNSFYEWAYAISAQPMNQRVEGVWACCWGTGRKWINFT